MGDKKCWQGREWTESVSLHITSEQIYNYSGEKGERGEGRGGSHHHSSSEVIISAPPLHGSLRAGGKEIISLAIVASSALINVRCGAFKISASQPSGI